MSASAHHPDLDSGPADPEIKLKVFKRQARALRLANPDLAHHQALDQIAKGYGYENWSRFAFRIRNGTFKGGDPVFPTTNPSTVKEKA